MKKSKLEQVETKAPPIEFNTTYFVAVHGDEPKPSKKGDYTFQPPRHLGKSPVECIGMTYSKAKKTAIEWIGERPAYGTFVLLP